MAKKKKPKCLMCKKTVKCRCIEFDLQEGGIGYFCSNKCAKKFENKYSVDVEVFHISECEQRGFYKKKWVNELQKQFLIWREQALERHRLWLKLKGEKRKMFDDITSRYKELFLNMIIHTNDEFTGDKQFIIKHNELTKKESDKFSDVKSELKKKYFETKGG